jgi:hypothetical protein
MKPQTAIKTVLGTAATLCILALTGQQAFAGTLHQGWNYSIDSFNDGTEGRIIGDKSKFEFYGMAYKQTQDKVYFAINSNLSTQGYSYNNVLNGKISYGDLMLNFKDPTSFNKANGSLYGVRFDTTNDTFTTQTTKKVNGKNVTTTTPDKTSTGLYQNVTATSYTTKNSGYGTINSHTNAVAGYKGKADYGDMAANTSYFDNTKAAPTNIGNGSFLGAIEQISDFSGLGLDFAHFKTKGAYTFGFSIDKKYLPNGTFVASLFAECGNDGMVLMGELTDVPEPSAMAGLALLGLTVAASRAKRRQVLA